MTFTNSSFSWLNFFAQCHFIVFIYFAYVFKREWFVLSEYMFSFFVVLNFSSFQFIRFRLKSYQRIGAVGKCNSCLLDTHFNFLKFNESRSEQKNQFKFLQSRSSFERGWFGENHPLSNDDQLCAKISNLSRRKEPLTKVIFWFSTTMT